MSSPTVHASTSPANANTNKKLRLQQQQQQQQNQAYHYHQQQQYHNPQTPPTSPTTNKSGQHSPQQRTHLPTTPPSSNPSPATKRSNNHLKSRIPVPTYYTAPQTPPRSPTTSSASHNNTTNTPPQYQRPSPAEKAAQDQKQRRQETQRYYADMLRQARQALQTLQHHHHHGAVVSAANAQAQAPPPPPPARTLVYPAEQQQQRKIPILPGGAFVVLTGEEGTQPAICIPNSPQPQQQHQYFHQQQKPLIQPVQLNAPPMQAASIVSPPQKSVKRKPIPLTKGVVETIQQDTRMARWQRVQGYVRDQRRLITTSIPTETSHWSPHLEIEQRVRETEAVEAEDRSLWSGGSAGTNGVDEFVWDDDEEEDQEAMRRAWGVEEWERERLKREWQVEQQRLQEEMMRIRMESGDLPPLVPAGLQTRHQPQMMHQQQQQQPQHQEERTPPQLKAYTNGFLQAEHSNPHLSYYGNINPHQLLPASQYLFHPSPTSSPRTSIGLSHPPAPPPPPQPQHLQQAGSVDGAVFRMDAVEPMDLDAYPQDAQHRPGKSASRRELRQRASQLAAQSQGRESPLPGTFAQPTAAWLGRTRGAYLEALRRYESRVGAARTGNGNGVGRAY